MKVFVSSFLVSGLWHYWVGDPADEFPVRLLFVLAFSYPIDYALRRLIKARPQGEGE